MIRDARTVPQMANDMDLVHAEARMWQQRKDLDKARTLLEQGLKVEPNNLRLFRSYLEVLLAAKDPAMNRAVLAATDPAVKQKNPPWWMYEARGKARKALDDKQAAMEEFAAGIDAASAARDDDGVARIARTIAEEIGVQQAVARVVQRAEKGDNRWRLTVAVLLQIQPDIPAAIGWVEKVLQDPKSTPEELVAAQRLAGELYLRLDPPDASKAVSVYKTLLEKQGDDPAMLNNLACTMILPNSGFTAKDALPYAEKAHKIMEQLGHTEPLISDTYGYVLVLTGRFDEGIDLLRKALDKRAFPEGYYHLAEAYLAMPNPAPADAEEALKKALTLMEQAGKENQSVDATLKQKIDAAMERARQQVPGGAPPAAAAPLGQATPR
jgi:tetratricopeptide (TPR) repeat protein